MIKFPMSPGNMVAVLTLAAMTAPMPAKGGAEKLTEAEARLVLDYMRRKFGN